MPPPSAIAQTRHGSTARGEGPQRRGAGNLPGRGNREAGCPGRRQTALDSLIAAGDPPRAAEDLGDPGRSRIVYATSRCSYGLGHLADPFSPGWKEERDD
jgi:hypothetical protein